MTWEVFVTGVPEPQGSTNSFVVRFTKGPRAGKLGAVTTSANKNLRPWRNAVSAEANAAWLEASPAQGPVVLELQFFFARLKGHYGKRGLLASAPTWKDTQPDLDKLARGVIDALADAGVLRNDSQVVDLRARKVYGGGEAEHRLGCLIKLWRP